MSYITAAEQWAEQWGWWDMKPSGHLTTNPPLIPLYPLPFFFFFTESRVNLASRSSECVLTILRLGKRNWQNMNRMNERNEMHRLHNHTSVHRSPTGGWLQSAWPVGSSLHSSLDWIKQRLWGVCVCGRGGGYDLWLSRLLHNGWTQSFEHSRSVCMSGHSLQHLIKETFKKYMSVILTWASQEDVNWLYNRKATIKIWHVYDTNDEKYICLSVVELLCSTPEARCKSPAGQMEK